MPEPNAVEPTIDDLRGMLAPEKEIDEKPAPAEASAEDGETAPDSEPEEKQEATDRGTDGKFKAKEPEDTPGVKKRIGKLLEEKRRSDQRVQELEAKLATGPQPAAAKAAETAQPAKPAPTRPRPVAKDFDEYEKYVDDLTDWKIEQSKAADAKATSDRQVAAAQRATATAWQERVEAVREIHPDFDEVLAGAASLPISQAMHETIMELERGPEVAYVLAAKPEEAKRIAKLGPLAAAAALGAIAAALPGSKEPAKPAAAAARQLPKPPAKVSGASAPAAIDLNDDKVNQSVWSREFKKRLKKDRAA